MAIINGTTGNDRLVGTDGDDEIRGLEGDDTIEGGFGGDFLFGDAGSDIFLFTAFQPSNAQTRLGLIDGGADNDTIDFRAVSPVIFGLIQNNAGANVLGATVGTQRFEIRNVETVLFGASNDVITTPGNLQTFLTLRAGGGNDTMFIEALGAAYGEDGDDNIFISGAFGASGNGIADGGSGFDILRISAGFTVDLDAGTARAGATSFTVSGFEQVQVSAVGGTVSTVLGSQGRDILGVNPTVNDGTRVILDGRGGDDLVAGGRGGDDLSGGAGQDVINGGIGDDRIDGGDGVDTAIFLGARSDYQLTFLGDGQVRITGADGVDVLSNVERVRFDDGLFALGPARFGGGRLVTNTFGTSDAAGGWSSDDRYPRELADVNGDGRADIIGFGDAGVYVSLANANGGFGEMRFALAEFGPNAGGWSSDDRYPREVADVNGDGRADLVGFGENGVYVALANGNGGFGAVALATDDFGASNASGGWASDDRNPRVLADVNGDGRADIVGFGDAGVYLALGNANGGFGDIQFALAEFGTNAGGWLSDDRYPRQVADVNGDGRADLVGFGENGVYVALANSTGGFGAVTLATDDFGASDASGGWASDGLYPRELADVNGDGRADIVGFGDAGAYIALGNADGSFGDIQFALAEFGVRAGNWTSDDLYPRQLADVNGDGLADIVGFGIEGVNLALGQALVPIA